MVKQEDMKSTGRTSEYTYIIYAAKSKQQLSLSYFRREFLCAVRAALPGRFGIEPLCSDISDLGLFSLTTPQFPVETS